jgi:hypothetical protein
VRTIRFGFFVTALAIALGAALAAPASANPSSGHGQGGAHSNRYTAQACSQGGHQTRVEAETGRAFRSPGDCTSHAALGGTLGAAAGQITFAGTPEYRCDAPQTGACWGNVSMSGVPSGSFALIIWRQTNQVQARIVPDANGNFNGNANVPCGLGDHTSTFYAFIVGGTSTTDIPATC